MDSNTKPLLTSKVRKRKVNNIDHSLSTYAKFSEKLSSLTPWLYMKVRSSISKSAVTSNHPEILYFAKWKIKNWSFLFRSSEKPTPNEVEEAVLSCEFVIRLENSWYFFKHLIHCFFFQRQCGLWMPAQCYLIISWTIFASASNANQSSRCRVVWWSY